MKTIKSFKINELMKIDRHACCRQRCLPILFLFLAVQNVVASDVLKAELVNQDNRFHEVHEPEVNVSGNVVVGVMTTSVSAALIENSVGILSPNAGTTKVCLKVTSRDGAYRSQNEYSVEAAAPTVVYLPYQSGMKKIVRRYAGQKGAIAVSATYGECAKSATADFYLPAKLDQDNATLVADNVSVFINGFDATDVFYNVAGQSTQATYDCHFIEEGRHTAYNFVCEIPVELLYGSGSKEIAIFREVYGRELGSIAIRLMSTL